MPDLPEAMCKGQDPFLWFGPHVCGPECDGDKGCMTGKSEQGRFNRITEAKTQCFACPVRLLCLEWAIETNQDFGIWGSCTERERRKIKGLLKRYECSSVRELLSSPHAKDAIRQCPTLGVHVEDRHDKGT